jgi:polyisoprenoid-binding protein YceI
MMRPLYALAPALLLMGLSAPLAAQPAAPAGPPGKADPAGVTGGTYAAEGGHSQVLFTYAHFGITWNMGLLSGVKGTLTLDPKAPNNAKVSVEVPINTIHTTIAKLDEEFVAAMFFDAAKFPTAKFESTSVKASGTKATIMGNLTIKGVTKPATIEASFVAVGANPYSKKETVSFKGTTTIKRSDFGLGMAVPMVGDEVKMDIMVAFEKQ